MTDYIEIQENLEAIIRDVPYFEADLANASAYLYEMLPDLNWCGFYLMNGAKLVLGPFQGKVACVEIPLGNGVCGHAAKENRTFVVPNVHEFDGHIACDSASNSEIVVPIRYAGTERVAGVLDIDSTAFSRFSEEDREGLEACVRIFEQYLFASEKN